MTGVTHLPTPGSGSVVVRRWEEEGGQYSPHDPGGIGFSYRLPDGSGASGTFAEESGFEAQLRALREAGYEVVVERGHWQTVWIAENRA